MSSKLKSRFGAEVFVGENGQICIEQENPGGDALLVFETEEIPELIEALRLQCVNATHGISEGGSSPDSQECLPPDTEDLENEVRLQEMERGQLESILGSRALAKACQDPDWHYAMKLKSGEVIAFNGAEVINNNWVHILPKLMCEQPEENRIAYPADRGIDVRLSEIVWVMDAPNGG